MSLTYVTYAATYRNYRHTLFLHILLLSFFTLLLFFPTHAKAHRVNIFAWVEGTTVMVQGGFSRSNPARQALIQVFDAKSGAELVSGKTDEKGLFSFPIPEHAATNGLRIAINAGEGHRNETTLLPEEFSAVEGAVSKNEEGASAEKKEAPTQEDATSVQEKRGEQPSALVSSEELRRIVREELSRELAPVKRHLAALEEKRIGMTDILGGLGWIIGLFGLFFALRAPKAQDKQ